MRLIAILIYENAFGNKVAQIVDDEDTNGNPRYFKNVEQITQSISRHFPGDVICLNLETLKAEKVFSISDM